MQPFHRYLSTILLAFFCISIAAPMALPTEGTILHAQRQKKKPAATKGAAKKKPAKGSTAKKGRAKESKRTAAKGSRKKKDTRATRTRPAREPKVAVIPPRLQVLPESTYAVELADGVVHRRITTVGKQVTTLATCFPTVVILRCTTVGKQVANVVTIDLKSGARLRTFKAHQRNDGLQTATDIGLLAGETFRDTVIAAINGSFWRAGTNTPIGATITDGEVIEMPGYKQWSSFLVYEDGTAAIERISLEGELFWRFRRLRIEGVNRRPKGESGIVVYNQFYGDSLPRGSRKSDSAIIAEAFVNKVGADVGDDTEGEGIDTAEIIRSYREGIVLEDREHPYLKIACKPLPPRRKRDPVAPPAIDDTMRLMVVEVDTGVVAMPENGYVISLGDAAEWFTVAQPGDTLSLLYSITPRQPKQVREAITGTPRLVRNGTADPEHETEGSRARRFVDGKLSRTAVGISRGGDTIILVTINSPNTSEETTGMSLDQIAAFMAELGAYQAMNFDGGGSASMAINGEMISRQGTRPTSRRVSNAVLVVKPFQDRKPARRRPAASPPPRTELREESAP